jgi:hypothetical protein
LKMVTSIDCATSAPSPEVSAMTVCSSVGAPLRSPSFYGPLQSTRNCCCTVWGCKRACPRSV